MFFSHWAGYVRRNARRPDAGADNPLCDYVRDRAETSCGRKDSGLRQANRHNWKIKILKEANYGSTVTVKTWSRDTNKLYTYRDFEIYDENNNLICIASSKWVLLSTKTGHITQITNSTK